VAHGAKEEQYERRDRPGEVAEFVGGVRNPVAPDQREDELREPSPEKDPIPRSFTQPEKPQGDETEKKRPGRKGDVAGP